MLQSSAAPGTKLGDVQDEFKLFEAGKAILAEVLTENALAKGVIAWLLSTAASQLV